MLRIIQKAVLVLFGLIFSGCIILSTPEEKAIVMNPDETMLFSIEVYPARNEFVWYLDDKIIPGIAGNTYTYVPGDETGDHIVTVECDDDTHSWLIHVLDNKFVGTNPCVEDTEGEFDRIWPWPEGLSFWDNGLIPWPRYTQAIVNGIGIDNHFQGIQRLRNGPYIVISGSNILDRTGSIFIARMASRPSSGTFGSNLMDSSFPPFEDQLINAIDVDTGLLWHAGGMSAVGDILVVPLEEYKEAVVSKIYFFDVSNPEAPVMYDYYIDRTNDPLKDKAGAVAMTMLADGRYLLATWDNNLLHFYLSNSSKVEDGFDTENVVTWNKNNLVITDDLEKSFGGSTINFIKQCDGQLYLAAFNGSNGDLGPFIPFLQIENQASLYRVNFPNEDYATPPVITKVASRRMYSGEKAIIPLWGVPSHTDFVAAAGIYIDPAGRLSIYSAPHYRNAGIIKFSEFSSY